MEKVGETIKLSPEELKDWNEGRRSVLHIINAETRRHWSLRPIRLAEDIADVLRNAGYHPNILGARDGVGTILMPLDGAVVEIEVRVRAEEAA